MSTYKLIQDIEAEDHILGPLTLRQFIFALVAAFSFYISFICFAKHLYFLIAVFLPPGLFCFFFAMPFGKDQPTEIWALAKLRFLFKPRKRIWDQAGIKELVTITAPKKIERVLTDGLSQREVKSRLQALASTIDTRGWAVKNATVSLPTQPNSVVNQPSDRLVDVSNVPQEVPGYQIQASDDMLDVDSNPIAQQFDQLITESSQTRRQALIDKMNAATPSPAPSAQSQVPRNDYWFMNQAQAPTQAAPGQVMFDAQVVQPVDDNPVAGQAPAPGEADEAALSARLKAAHETSVTANSSHMRVLQPLGSNQRPADSSQQVADTQDSPEPVDTASQITSGSGTLAPFGSQIPTPGPSQPDPAILSLANNNDLNVATIAREAYKVQHGNQRSQDEVVISLH